MSAGTDRLASSRRVDWRFLFADPALGDVALLGRPDASLHEALQAFADSVTVDPAPRRPHVQHLGGGVDVVAAVAPDGRDLGRVIDTVRAGADGYVELPSRRHTVRALLRIRRAGVAATVWSCWPDAATATARARPTDRWAQREAAARLVSPLRRRVAGVAARLGLGAITARATCITLAPIDTPERLVPAAASLATDVAGCPTSAGRLVLTPRFAASRHVVTLVSRADGGVAVKTPRLVDDVEEITAEQRGLAALPGPGGWPRSYGLVDHVGRPWLVSTLVPGRPIDRRTARRDGDMVATLVTGWLRTLPVGTATAPVLDGRDRLVDEAASSILRWSDPHGRITTMVAATSECWRRLVDLPLPVVFEHGDVRPPNLFLDGDRLVVVDWELAEPQGLPLHDLAHLLTYLRDAGSIDEARIAHDLCAELHRIGLADDLVADLEAVSWMRRVAGLASRSVDRTAGGAVDEGRILRSDLVTGWASALDRASSTCRHTANEAVA